MFDPAAAAREARFSTIRENFRSCDNQIGTRALFDSRFHLFEGFAVRWLMAAVLTALTSLLVNAAEPAAVEAPDAEGGAAVAEQAVTVTPVPMPVPVTELRAGTARSAEVRSARQAKAAKVAKARSIGKSMLSRTERHQVALLASRPEPGASLPHVLGNGDDDEYGAADLVLHRSFSRPKVVTVNDEDDEDDLIAIPDGVKLRLFLARMKAVEALAMARVADPQTAGGDDLPDAVRQRLQQARMNAVEAHRKKFS